LSESKGLVCLAGPAYSPEEGHALEVLAKLLDRKGWEVYMPATQGLEPHFLALAAEPPGSELQRFREVVEKAAFALEIFQLVERCDALVFNMNGRVPDEGGVFKTAVAFTAGKPLILYKRDHRSKLHGNDNAMLPGLSYSFSHVRKAKKIPGKLEKALQKSQGFGGRPYAGDAVPPFVRQITDQGRQVWEALQRFQPLPGDRKPSALEALYQEIARIFA